MDQTTDRLYTRRPIVGVDCSYRWSHHTSDLTIIVWNYYIQIIFLRQVDDGDGVLQLKDLVCLANGSEKGGGKYNERLCRAGSLEVGV
jgi:hypothetical protein